MSQKSSVAETAIAIIGASCRFDGAEDPATLWQRLLAGEGLLRRLSDAELRAAGFDPATLDAAVVPVGAVVPEIASFDTERFGIAAREASLIDPQHRLFLELALEAFENAGHDPATIGGPVGVFGGAAFASYLMHQLLPAREQLRADDEFAVMIGNNKDHLAARVAFLLDLRGPAVNVQSACSTSLLAVHLACQSLLQGECDFALAGGVSLEIPQGRPYFWQAGGVLSPDGCCRAFDAAAAGTVPGNGGGMVLLRPLAAALDDGDHILAVIEASAANNDGAGKMAYTAPAIDGQAAVIAEALALAGVTPAAIGYVETHGTGTPMGDPIEVAALRQAFEAAGGSPDGQRCLLGAVKTHLGHCDAAAGIAGLLAAALAVEAGEVPAVRHFREANPHIDFGPFKVNARRSPWPLIAGLRRAGVSSFGIGGTNVHLVLAEAPAEARPRPRPAATQLPERPQVVLLSAASPGALEAASRRLADSLEAAPSRNLSAIAGTLAWGRPSLSWRRALVAANCADLVAALRDSSRHFDGRGGAARRGSRKVAFLLPGQGAQRPDMAQGLAPLTEFSERLAAGLEYLRGAGLDLLPLLVLPAGADREAAAAALERTDNAQAALTVMSLALAAQWQAWGIEPAALLGHSVGELAAACLAGVFDEKTVLELVAERGRLLAALPGGGMAAVPLAEEELRSRLRGTPIELAAINGDRLATVAGPEAALGAWIAALAAEGIEVRRLHTSHAFHSAAVEPALAPFRRAVAAARPRPPRIPLISNVSGRWLTAAEATDPDYWANHLRAPVLFAAGLKTLTADSPLLLEVGPGQALSALARGAGFDAVASLPISGAGAHPGEAALLAAAGRLWTVGGPRPSRRLFGEIRRVVLPTYPFERRRCWIEAASPAAPFSTTPAPGSLAKRSAVEQFLYVPAFTRLPQPKNRARSVEPVGEWWIVADPEDAEQRRVAAAIAAELTLRHESFSALAPAGPFPPAGAARVIYLGALGQGTAAAIYDGALAVVRAAAATPGRSSCRLIALTDRLYGVIDDGEARRPEQAVLQGPWLVAPQESPGLTSLVVDLDLPASAELTAALAARLLDQLAAGGEGLGSGVVALRGEGGRASFWRASFEPLAGAPVAAATWEPGAVVLITGGLGRIGRVLAEDLVRRHGVVVVAAGRRSADRATRDWAASLAPTRTGRLEIEEADVTDPAAMKQLLERVAARHGKIDVVVHAAGITGEAAHTPIERLAPADRERHFAPKITGAENLLEAIVALRDQRQIEVGAVLLCSSLSTVLGGLGFGAYAAANAFLDAFAGHAGRRCGLPFMAVDWDGWFFGATGSAAASPAGAEALALTVAEGLAVFERLPALLGLERLVVSTAELAARQALWTRSPGGRAMPRPADSEAVAAARRPASAPPYLPPSTATEEILAQVWSDLLGFAPIGLADDFFELGGHSLLATQMVSRLREKLGIEMSVAAVFDAPKLRGLAALLDGLGPGPAAAATATAPVEEREEFEL